MSGKTSSEILLDEQESSAKIAQVFSAIMFFFIVVYLVFSNSTKLSFIQQASQEKRLAVCCSISTGVAAISCFLNVFQITEVDNFILPEREGVADGYTVDLARPVEWILTCPMMQLALVLMGGSRIPEYRRLLMPAFSAVIVLLGTLSLYVETPFNWVCYVAGFSLFLTMSNFNRMQIIEFSNGTEGFFSGDSEFRKATLILVFTWLPFPTWFALSPEGFNVITNILAIQIGWMILNLVSKGALILYVQRAKDNYVARLKVNRLMKGAQGGASADNEETNQANMTEASLGPCVSETMTFLGMADKSERFLRLLKDAKINSLDKVANLTPEDCKAKKLPWDLVNALQKRFRIWTLEVADDAEDGLERGESYYLKTKAKNEAANQQLPEAQPFPVGFQGFQPPPPPGAGGGRPRDSLVDFTFAGAGMATPPEMMGPRIDESGAEEILTKLQGVEDSMLQKLSSLEQALEAKVERSFANMESSFQSGNQQVLASCDMNSQKIDQKIDKGLQAVSRDVGKSTGACQQAITSGLQTVSRSLERSEVAWQEKIASCFNNEDKRLQYIADDMQTRLAEVGENLAEQTAAISRNSQTTLSDVGRSLDRSLEEIRVVLTTNKTDVLQDLDNMIEKMTQTVITDAKSNAFTLTSKVSSVEEAQSRNCADLANQFQKCLHDGMRSASDNQGDHLRMNVLQQISEEFRQFQDSRGRQEDEWSQDFARSLKEVHEHVEKHVQVAVGVLTNTLRAQLDDIEEMHKDTQAKMHDHVKENQNLMEKLEYTLQKDLNDQKHSHQGLMNKLENELKRDINDQKMSNQGLMNKLEHELKKDINDQKQLSSSVLEQAAAAQFRSKECCEMMAELSDRMAPGAPQSSQSSERGMPQQMNGMPSPTNALPGASPMQRPQTAGPRRYPGSGGPGL